MRKGISLILIILMLLTITVSANAESVVIVVNGKSVTVSTSGISHDYATSLWNSSCKNKTVGSGGHICCSAYTERMFTKIWGKQLNGASSKIPNMLSKLSADERKITVEHCREFFSQAAPGAAVRVQYSSSKNRSDVGPGKYGHDLIFLSANDKGGVFYSGNHGGTGEVVIWRPTWEEFVRRFVTWRAEPKQKKKGYEPYYYFAYIRWPGATPYSPYTVIEDNLDDYYTAQGLSPDPSADGIGFSIEKLYGGPSSLPTYTSPDASSTVASNKWVLSYFHVIAKVSNKNGETWFKLEDGSFIQPGKLSLEPWFHSQSNVQLGLYMANIKTQWGKAPFDAHDQGTDIALGEEVEVIFAITNKYNKTWYQIAPKDEGKWVYSEHVTFVQSIPQLSISGEKAPSGQRKQGSGFELKGKISSNENIVSVVGTVYNQQTGSTPTFSTNRNPATITPNAKSVEIYTSAINTSLKFGELPAGSYRYELKATTSSGYEKVLVNSTFTVIGEDDPSLGDQIENIPVTSISLNTSAIELEQGKSYRIITTIAPDNATNQGINWTSSSASVATVDSHGLVSAVGVGNATITATTVDGSNVSKQAVITVVAPQASTAGFEYTITDGKATITGSSLSGAVSIPSTIEGCPVVRIKSLGNGKITSIFIPKTVTDMYGLFYQDRDLISAYFEYGSTIVPAGAFYGCYSLENVSIPDTVSEIGYVAFSGCDLSSVHLPTQLKKIGFNAFSNNSRLSEIEFPSGLTEMGDHVFSGTSITSVFIPNSVTKMEGTFWGCNTLIDAYFEDGITSIPGQALRGAASLESVYIPESVTQISYHAFAGCSKLTSVDLPSGLKKLGSNAFTGTGITDIFIPKTVTDMGEAFSGCETIVSVVFEDGMTTIPAQSLWKSSVQRVFIPESVTKIGYWAFKECSSLATITIPSGVTTIQFNAFSNCSNLTDVEILGRNTNFEDNSVFSSSPQVVITCWRASAANSYAVDNDINYVLFDEDIPAPVINWGFVLPTGTKTIESEAFSNIAAVSIKLPESVETIESKAFYGCSSLAQIYVPDSCTSIALDAFDGTNGLTIYGTSGSYVETFAIDNGIAFFATSSLSERIRQYIMDDSPNKPYDSSLDLDENGVINSVDYIIARKAEIGMGN